MDIRFFFSAESLTQNGVTIHQANSKNGDVFFLVDGSRNRIAQAHLSGSHYHFDDKTLNHSALSASLSHMTIYEYVNAVLTRGHYKGIGWEAQVKKSGDSMSVVNFEAKGITVDELKLAYQQLVSGALLPAFTVEDIQLTSEQVANVILGDGSREHWLSVVQGAQDAMTKTFEHIQVIQAQMVELKARNAELEALVAGQGK